MIIRDKTNQPTGIAFTGPEIGRKRGAGNIPSRWPPFLLFCELCRRKVQRIDDKQTCYECQQNCCYACLSLLDPTNLASRRLFCVTCAQRGLFDNETP